MKRDKETHDVTTWILVIHVVINQEILISDQISLQTKMSAWLIQNFYIVGFLSEMHYCGVMSHLLSSDISKNVIFRDIFRYIHIFK